jgi:hypothetical protein
VCEVELRGLLKHFRDDRTMGSVEKQNVIDAVVSVLSSLPKAACAGVSSETKFHPEMTFTEQQELNVLLSEKQKLQAYSEMLARYEQHIDTLGLDNEIWMGALPSQNSSAVALSDSMNETAMYYANLLQDMQKYCDAVIRSVDDSTVLQAQARRLQDDLYDAFNQARNEAQVINTTSSAAPADTRDAMRHMPSLM